VLLADPIQRRRSTSSAWRLVAIPGMKKRAHFKSEEMTYAGAVQSLAGAALACVTVVPRKSSQ
jgi:hypothetical protein